MRGIRLIVLSGLALGPASAALASDQGGTTPDQWKEEASGGINGAADAGQSIVINNGGGFFNQTRGAGPLNKITGTFQFTRDVDMYCITITDGTAFSAVVAGTTDTNLALFDTAGHGIAFNDNNPAGGTAAARLSNLFTSSLSPGLYILAVNRNDSGFGGSTWNYPLDTNNLNLFQQLGGFPNTTPPPNRNVEYGPNDPSAVYSNYQYNNIGFEGFNVNYTITLTGAGYHQLPAPGAGVLLGLGGLVAARRRR